MNLATIDGGTWCQGCHNFCILASVNLVLAKLIKEGHSQEKFAMVTGVGCHAKMYDYLNISGIYGLHGRVIPTSIGMKLGNPDLTVLGFAGDGDTYAEGMSHFIHAGRHNSNFTLVVHDNQGFSLTTGQAAPTTQQGYKNKSQPTGEFRIPLNPIKLALASGVNFIARVNAKDIKHTVEILEKAIKHNGFSFVEVIQNCIIFNLDINNKENLMYKIPDNNDINKASELANEWDYNGKEGKISVGVIFQKEGQLTLEEAYYPKN